MSGGFRAYFEFLAEDPDTVALMRRNSGTIRAMFDEPALGAGIDELRADLEAAVAQGWIPPHDADLMAVAMVGAGRRDRPADGRARAAGRGAGRGLRNQRVPRCV